MPQPQEFHTAPIAAMCIFENFVGLHVQKAKPHSPNPHDSFQMSSAPAPAITLAWIQRHNHMAAFPNTFAPGIDAEADAVAQRPHANHTIEMAARSRYASRHNIRVVVNVYGGQDAGSAQRLSHQVANMRAFELLQVG